MNIEVNNLSVPALLDIYRAINSCTEVDPDFKQYVLDRMPLTLDVHVKYDPEAFLRLYAEGYDLERVVAQILIDSAYDFDLQ